MNSIYKTPKKSSDSPSSDRFATCSMITGIAGVICSFFYLPISMASGASYYFGLVCGVVSIVLALLSRRSAENTQRRLQGRAIAGIILGVLAICLTLFFFYALISFYDALNDPVTGPQLNQMINQMQQQMQRQLQQSR